MPLAARAFKGTDIHITSKANVPSTIRRSSMLLWSKGTTAAATLDRPMIVVEGIDGENKNDHASYLALGSAPEAPLFKTALDAQGDLLFFDFADGGRDMRQNADQVIGAVEYIRNTRTPSTYNFDVAGVSMGGVVARYALAKFEQETWRGPHGVKHFISIDAPQTGAVFDLALQDYMIEKGIQPVSLTCMAAKQLLRMNRFDPYSAQHQAFFSDLNALNGGTGYPQQTQNIGVSFGTPTPNPYADQDWVSVEALAWGGGQVSIKKFAVREETNQGGSYLPEDVTRLWGFSGWWVLPGGTFTYELNRLAPKHPTFIPYNSALGIVNGVSAFPAGSRFAANRPYFHNEVPPEIVIPLMTRLGYVTPLAPLAVSISGPTSLAYNATGTWTAAFNRASAVGYTYAWEWRIVMTSCDDGGAGARTSRGGGIVSPQRVSQCVWSPGSTGYTFSYRADTNARLELRVTVSNGTESAMSSVFYVQTGSGPSGGGGALLAAPSDGSPEADVAVQAEAAPTHTALERVWPVPAAAGTPVRVAYALAEAGAVRVQVADVLGRVVWQYDDAKEINRHVLHIPTEGFSAGAYVLTLTAHGQTFTRRLVLH